MSNPEQVFFESLRHTQWLSPEGLTRYQRPLIERMIRHAATQTDYYQERLRPLFDGSDWATANINLGHWADIPISTRADAVEHLDRMTARDVPSFSGAIVHGQSSGSTGKPLRHLRSALADTVSACLTERIYELFDVDRSGSLAYMTMDREKRFPYPDGAIFNSWNRTVAEAKFFVLDIGASADEQLEWLERMRPDHVMTYPMTFREVAEAVLARGKPRFTLRTFIATGEVLDGPTCDLIVRAFNCRVIDIYGAREIGPIAFQCPDADGYHICAESIICELVDSDGNPTPPGEYGRVVVTSLYNFAMPFIRYDIGDYALASALPCRCGRGLPAVDQIGGRTRSRLIMPDGSRRRLRGKTLIGVEKFLAYKQIQIVQTEINTLLIKFVPSAEEAMTDVDGLVKFLRQEFHPALDVQLVKVDRIERSAGFKVEQFITLVDPA